MIKYVFLREPQHTPCFAYPRHPMASPNERIPNHKVLVEGFGVCSRVMLENSWGIIWVVPPPSNSGNEGL